MSEVTDTQSVCELPIQLSVVLRPSELSWWENNVGQDILTQSGVFHRHGLLAASRELLEILAIRELSKEETPIVDVGANPGRTSKHLRVQDRYMVPLLQHGDHHRLNSAPRGLDICTCTFETCTHLNGHNVLASHSAYYLDPLVVYQSMQSGRINRMVVIGHVFDDVVGGFRKEATYRVSAQGDVSMHVNGNSEPYVHPLLPWQRGWRGPSGERFFATPLETIAGFTMLWELEIGFGRVEIPKPFAEVLTDNEFAGPVQYADNIRGVVSNNAKIVHADIDLHEIRSFGPFLYTETLISGKEMQVLVPKARIGEVARAVAGRPRNPALWAELVARFGYRSQGDRIPSEHATASLMTALTLGFVQGLDFEVNAMYTMHHNFSWLYKLHSQLTEFELPKVMYCGRLLVLIILLIIAFSLAEFYTTGKLQHIVVPAIGVSIFTILFLIVLCARGIANVWRDTQLRNWRAHYGDYNPRAGYVDGFVPLVRAERVLPPTHLVAPVSAVAAAQMTDKPPSARYRPSKTGLSIDGVAFSNVSVNTIADTRETEASAIANRVLVPSPWPTPDFIFGAKEFIKKSPDFKFRGGVKFGRRAVDDWIAGLKSKGFSAAYIDNAKQAANLYMGKPPPAEGLIGRPFLKKEKSPKNVQLEGQEAQKPRIIVEPGIEMKVMTGPFIEQLYNRVKSHWQREESKVVYASGISLERLGARVDAFVNKHDGKVVGFNVDRSALDATLKLPGQVLIMREVYEAIFHMPRNMSRWCYSLRSKGTLPAGTAYDVKTKVRKTELNFKEMKYVFDFLGQPLPPLKTDEEGEYWEVDERQMCSGRPDTNLMDTLYCALTTLIAVQLLQDFLLLVCGDDAFLLAREEDAGPIEETVRRVESDAGLIPKIQRCAGRHEWEFCSKLFWKGISKGGVSQTVLGAKPGRALARKGYITNRPGEQSIRSALTALSRDAAHVPFLNEIVEHDLALAVKAKAKLSGKAESHELHTGDKYGVDPYNWVLLYDRYGLTQDEVSSHVANYTTTVTSLSGLVTLPVVGEMAAKDE